MGIFTKRASQHTDLPAQAGAAVTIEAIFARIKKMAQNPVNEIYARSYANERDGSSYASGHAEGLCTNMSNNQEKVRLDSLKDPIVLVSRHAVDACGMTVNGVLAAMYHDNHSVEKILEVDLRSVAKFGTGQLSNLPSPEDFNTFDIRFDGVVKHPTHHELYPVAHRFMVVQYLDQNLKNRYRFFQSYMGKYSLQEFINQSEQNNNSHDLDADQFKTFLHELYQFIDANTWTKEIETFYQKYFNVKTNYIGWEIYKNYGTVMDENGCRSPLYVSGARQLTVEKRINTIDQPLKNWDRFHHGTPAQKKPSIIAMTNTDMFTKLTAAPSLKANDRRAMAIVVHDPVSGNHGYKHIDRSYMTTLRGIQNASTRKDKTIHYTKQYDPSLAGKVSVYPTLFAETRATLSGTRKPFANLRAAYRKEGVLLANTRSLLSGNRPLFANARRAAGLITDEEVDKSKLGVDVGKIFRPY